MYTGPIIRKTKRQSKDSDHLYINMYPGDAALTYHTICTKCGRLGKANPYTGKCPKCKGQMKTFSTRY